MGQILLVDDDPDILHILTATFECAGHRVFATLDPDEVQALLAGQRFDAMILDVMLPRRSGWEVLEELRRAPQTERLPVVMLSAIGDSANRVRGIRLGADDFLAKPFDPEELVARVEGLIGRRATTVGVLQGDFATFPLGEALQTLQGNATSGVLEVTTPGGGDGWLRLHEGSCTEASFGGLTGTEAVLALLAEKAGNFLLYNPPGQRGAKGEPLPAISRLLLESAWIEDELQSRRGLLPPADRGLMLTGPPAATLPALTGVPDLAVVGVLTALATAPGTSLSKLLNLRIAAPNRIRLTVACLIEAGRVCEEKAWAEKLLPTAPDPVQEELDALLEELTLESVLRGFPAAPVEVTVLVDPPARGSAERLLAGLRAPRFPRLGAAAIGAPMPSDEISVRRPHGELRLHMRPFAGSLPDAPWVRRSTALVLWLGEQPAEETVRSADTLERQADPRAFRLAISPGIHRPADRRMRILRQEPQDLAALLGAILSPLVEAG